MNRILLLLLVALTMKSSAQTLIPLYTDEIPNAKAGTEKEEKNVNESGQIRYGRVSHPTLEIHLPPKDIATGAAIVIVPGGGYRIVSYTNEGTDIAAEFNKMGIAAFILKYRLPSDDIMKDKSIGPLQDAQQAIKTVRSRAKEWNIDANKVGIIGFSAGGHLASTAGTHFSSPVIAADGISLRPDFMVLVYPVISFSDSLMHRGSKENLIGKDASPEMVKRFSNELQVSAETPPTLLVHSADDKTVKVANSIRFYESLLAKGVPAEMHLYPTGGHGFGIRSARCPDRWTDRVQHWLKGLGVIK